MRGEYHYFEGFIDRACSFLMPRGSCGPNRWLTFNLEATLKDGSTFRWLVQYRAASNYRDWRTVIPNGTPWVQMEHNFARTHGLPRWLPLDVANGEDLNWFARMKVRLGHGLDLRQGIKTEYDKDGQLHPHLAPGEVISSGCHDSCWRDHAFEFGRYNPETKKTEYVVDRWQFETVMLRSVTIEGDPRSSVMFSTPAWLDLITDGYWENTDGIEGPWAVLVATSKLAPCVGRDSVEVEIRAHGYDCPPGTEWKRKHKREFDRSFYYVVADGLVTHEGDMNSDRPWIRDGWTEVLEPYPLTMERHLANIGFEEFDSAKVDLTNLFAELGPTLY